MLQKLVDRKLTSQKNIDCTVKFIIYYNPNNGKIASQLKIIELLRSPKHLHQNFIILGKSGFKSSIAKWSYLGRQKIIGNCAVYSIT